MRAAGWTLALLLLVVACADDAGGPAEATTSTTPGTAPAEAGPAPTETTTTVGEAVETSSVPPTTGHDEDRVPSGSTAVVAAQEGILGWFDGTAWVQAQTTAPLEGDERFQVFRIGSEPTHADAAGLDRGCPVFEEGIGVQFQPSPWPDFDPFSPSGIAVSAAWDASPHPVEEIPVTEAHLGVADELLEGRGIDDPDPGFAQLVRTDLEGDGVWEVFGALERRTGEDGALNPAPAGDYSIAFARVVRGDEAETIVLGEWVVTDQEETGFIQDLVVFRIDAFADADGDGVDEVALRSSYYEGSGVALLDRQADGFTEVVSVGCGA